MGTPAPLIVWAALTQNRVPMLALLYAHSLNSQGYSLLAFRWPRLKSHFQWVLNDALFNVFMIVFRIIRNNYHFDSDGDFHRFMSNISKTGFTAILVRTAVHRARNIRLCGRHRFSLIFINAKICWNMSWLHWRRNPRIFSIKIFHIFILKSSLLSCVGKSDMMKYSEKQPWIMIILVSPWIHIIS